MKERIHKFKQADSFILLDVNSGAVHVVDEMIYDIMDVFDGANDRAVVDALGAKYPRSDVAPSISSSRVQGRASIVRLTSSAESRSST